MKKADFLTTLFVGIDVSSRSNVVATLDFEAQKPLETFSVANNRLGAVEMATRLQAYLEAHRNLKGLVIGLESTSFYGVHIANHLSSCEILAPASGR